MPRLGQEARATLQESQETMAMAQGLMAQAQEVLGPLSVQIRRTTAILERINNDVEGMWDRVISLLKRST